MFAFKKNIPFYQELIVFLFNNLMIFALVNIIFFLVFAARDRYFKGINLADEMFVKYDHPSYKKVYPGFTPKQINELLTEIWSRRYAYEPFTQFKESAYSGRYVNVDDNGFRVSKNQGPWPPVPSNFNVFLFGSSSVFNYGLPDHQTIASYLQEYFSKIGLKNNVYVYNFGRGHYFSTQELVLFQSLINSGFVPDLAIFIDGLSDFHNTNGKLSFTNELREFVDSKGSKKSLTKKDLLNAANGLPFFRGVDFIKRVNDNIVNKGSPNQQAKETITENGEEEKYKNEATLKKVINRYVNNKKIIEAVASIYGVKTIFVWQPVPMYKYDLSCHLFRPPNDSWHNHTFSKYGYPCMAEYIKKQPLGNNFLWCADMQEGLKEPLYVDSVHYTAGMSKRLAYTICDMSLKRKLLDLEKL